MSTYGKGKGGGRPPKGIDGKQKRWINSAVFKAMRKVCIQAIIDGEKQIMVKIPSDMVWMNDHNPFSALAKRKFPVKPSYVIRSDMDVLYTLQASKVLDWLYENEYSKLNTKMLLKEIGKIDDEALFSRDDG